LANPKDSNKSSVSTKEPGGIVKARPLNWSISNEMPQSAPSAVLTTDHGGNRSRILVVDDAPDNLALIRICLSDCNFELDYAENGKIAVDKVIAGHPDLVLMDLRMPGMGGLEATRAIRQWEANTNTHPPIPILAWTASVETDGIGGSLAAGCDEHLEKPIACSTLLEALSRHLNSPAILAGAR
jgi:CheY-like chemotaxis protein